MKKFHFFLIIWVSFCSNYILAEKRALVIAIGEYPEGSGWNKISGENDLKIIIPALIRQGFNDTLILKNEHATKSGVITSIKKLTTDSKTGDVVILHFSTHGQQVKDINGDEVDNMDEAIVCYDTPKTPTSKIQDSRNHLLDDELKIYLVALRQRLGAKGQLLVFFDACHSNSMSRGLSNVYRGTHEPFVTKTGVVKQNASKLTTLEHNKKLAPAVYISACQSDQLNKETNKGYGSLTYAVAQIFYKKDVSNYSLERFFKEIESVMKFDPVMKDNFGSVHVQNPKMTGNSELKIFAGTAVKIPKYFNVNNISKKTLTLNGGKLAGISPGSIVSLYAPDTFNPQKSKPFATLRIDSTDLIQSWVTVRGNYDQYKLKNSWAFISTSKEYKVNILKNLVPSKEIGFKIIPVTFQSKTKNNEYTFKPGDKFRIEISNNTAADLYFQLVTLNKNNDDVSVVFLERNEPEEFKVKKGEKKIPDSVELKVDNHDFGIQTLFMICSEQPIDLSSIESTRRKGVDNFDFEELLLDNKIRGVSNKNKMYFGKVNYNVTK